MRVFLDTNVLVSATATRGLCADLFREVLLSHHLVVSRPLLGEVERILAVKFGADPETIDGVLHLLHQDTTMASEGTVPDVDLADADDLLILATALDGDAEVFVTGDKAVQALCHVGEMQILSPRQFWEKLVGQPDAAHGRGAAGASPRQ